jgi:hypothetical protein
VGIGDARAWCDNGGDIDSGRELDA